MNKNISAKLTFLLFGIIHFISCIFSFDMLSDYQILKGFIPLFEPLNILLFLIIFITPLLLLKRIKEISEVHFKYEIILLQWVICLALFVSVILYFCFQINAIPLWSDKTETILNWGGGFAGHPKYLVNPLIYIFLNITALSSAYISLKSVKKIKVILLTVPCIIFLIIIIIVLNNYAPLFMG